MVMAPDTDNRCVWVEVSKEHMREVGKLLSELGRYEWVEPIDDDSQSYYETSCGRMIYQFIPAVFCPHCSKKVEDHTHIIF